MSLLPSPTVRSLLQQTREETALPLSELRILLGVVLGLDRVGLITNAHEPVPMDQLSAFKSLAARRQLGEPIAYLVGEQEFFSRPFHVNPHVLIPRPETEELVERALALLEQRAKENLLTRVLDIGTGSGAIAITLALENPILEVTGSDISTAALQVAQHNAAQLKAQHLRWVHSDVLDAFLDPHSQPPAQQFDLIVSNPPYIEAGDIHLSTGDLRFEPQDALTDHRDGYRFYERIAQDSLPLLRPAGMVLVEHGHQQQERIIELFKAAGFSQVTGFKDLANLPRMVLAHA